MKALKLTILFFAIFSIKSSAQTILNGDYKITGTLQINNTLNVLNTNPNTTQAVLARLPDETSLEIKAFNVSPAPGKLFSIENYFWVNRIKNSAINFWRGGGDRDGYITIDVYDGREICKFDFMGLEVYGAILAKHITISETGWADHVFAEDYQLPALSEVKQFIDENKHLPGIPTETEVKENGVNLGEMQVKLLQKIEELTLYMIQQENTIQELKNEIKEMKSK